jgi:hypothetical protein
MSSNAAPEMSNNAAPEMSSYNAASEMRNNVAPEADEQQWGFRDVSSNVAFEMSSTVGLQR